MFVSSRRVEPCISWPWKVKVKIWPQVKLGQGHSVTQKGQIIHHLMRLAETNAMAAIPRLYLIWFSSHWQKTVGDLEWPPWPLEGSPTKNFTWSINKYLTWCDSIHISSIWSIKQGVKFLPIDLYNGEVTKMTWPKVTDIKNPRYTFCRYRWPYHIPKVS